MKSADKMPAKETGNMAEKTGRKDWLTKRENENPTQPIDSSLSN